MDRQSMRTYETSKIDYHGGDFRNICVPMSLCLMFESFKTQYDWKGEK